MTYTLDFLLVVETFDHQIIKQDIFDKSKMGGASFFYDIKDLHIRRASLVGKGHLLTVDLVDGHLEVDGNTLFPPNPPPIGSKFDLIYYRQVQQRMMTGDGDNKVLKPVVRYYLGWKIRGTNKEWIAGLD